MSEKKKILILTGDAGFGHRSAANAIQAALEHTHPDDCESIILNLLEDESVPLFLRDSGPDYDKIIKNAPKLYQLGYEVSDNPVATALMDSVLTLALYEIISKTIKDYHPDAIVTTYPIYQAPLISYFTLTQYHVPLITAVTDLVSVHQVWFASGVTRLLVPTEAVHQLAVTNKVEPEKISITGIPVSPVFTLQRRGKRVLRQELGWDPNLPTFLAVGSSRVELLPQMLNVLNHFGRPLQIAAVAGKDEELYSALKSMDWHIPAHIYNYVENMPELMMAADAIVCKAGGLIVTESLACGLPIMLIDVLPGQEEGNRDYVVEKNAGVMINTPMEMLETLSHWLADGGKPLRQVACDAKIIGRPKAALDAAEIIWQAAQEGPTNLRHSSEHDRLPLINLLTHNDIPWQASQDKS